MFNIHLIVLLSSLIFSSITICSETRVLILDEVSKEHPGCRSVPVIHKIDFIKKNVIISEKTYTENTFSLQTCRQTYSLECDQNTLKQLELMAEVSGPTYLNIRNDIYVNGLWFVFNGENKKHLTSAS